MTKQKFQVKNLIAVFVKNSAVFVLVLVFLGTAVIHPVVKADQYDEQIKVLNQQNASTREQVNTLLLQAQSIEAVIQVLQQRINVLQAQLDANNARKADLETQIAVAEKELLEQKSLLGQNIRAMYLEGDISTLEMLASSKDLSEFLDKQEYRSVVSDKIKKTVDRITQLKLQLNQQKTEVETLIKQQTDLQNEVVAQRSEQDRLLGFNQSQRSAYNSQIKSNNASIVELRRQQLIANARFIGGAPGTGPACGGGYPARWCEIPQDSVIDSWGMYNRECVSYAAFKVAESGRHMPYWGGYGNANQWDNNARAMGIAVDGSPRVGDVAQTDAGGLGHVMYVEHVYGDGTILISQYNAGLDGRYSERRISAGGLNFIHF